MKSVGHNDDLADVEDDKMSASEVSADEFLLSASQDSEELQCKGTELIRHMAGRTGATGQKNNPERVFVSEVRD